jgi:hypothetical protein
VALAMLALRQHRLEVTAETVHIHDQILARRQSLLDQRVQIARQTNPWALAAGLKAAGMDTGAALEPRTSGVPTMPGPVIPQVETDLVAPLVGHSTIDDGNGHANGNRPRDK